MFDNSTDSVITLGELLRIGSVLILGIVSYFLRRSMATIDELEKAVHGLDKTVGILLDRDRRKRIEDYDRERERNREQS